jgi:hypothetical protein
MQETQGQVKLAIIQTDISYIKGEVLEIKNLVKEQYITKAEFEPVKRLVYGLVSIVLTGVIGAILYLVIQK